MPRRKSGPCGHRRCLRVYGLAVHMRAVIVRSFRHRGLRQLYETDSPKLLKQNLAGRVCGLLAALTMAETMEGFVRDAAPEWRVHRLSGARRNEWSVSVSGIAMADVMIPSPSLR